MDFNSVLTGFITDQTHYEKSDWTRAFNQFTIACELDMINAISAADIAFINTREKRSAHACLPCFRRIFAIEIIRDNKTN